MKRLLMAALFLSSTFLFADEPAETPKTEPLRARLGELSQDGQYAKIFIYSTTPLKKSEIRFENVEAFKDMKLFLATPEYVPFGTDSYYPAKPEQKYFVRGWREDGTRFTQQLQIVKNERGEFDVTVVPFSEESKEKVAAELAEAAKKAKEAKVTQAAAVNEGGDPLFNRINAYRVSRGLQPLIWDPSLCVADNAAHWNFRHGRIPGARMTNFAPATGDSAFNMWLNSDKGHHEHMLSGTHAGIGYSGGTATLNLR